MTRGLKWENITHKLKKSIKILGSTRVTKVLSYLLECFTESRVRIPQSTEYPIKIVTKTSNRTPYDVHVLKRNNNKTLVLSKLDRKPLGSNSRPQW